MNTKAYINGMGAFLPNEPVDNTQIENVLGLINDKPSKAKKLVLRNNGIKTRHYAIDPINKNITHTNVELTVESIKALVKNSSFDLNQLDCLTCGTSGPDQMIPNHALMVHGALGNPPCEVIATSGVCCSGVAAFKYAYMNVSLGFARNAVVTGSEQVSSILRSQHFQPEIDAKLAQLDDKPIVGFERDFLRWMLSDASGAALIENKPNDEGISLQIDWVDYISFANELETCMYGGCIKLEDGNVQGWKNIDNLKEAFDEGYFDLNQDVKLLADNIVLMGQRGLEKTKKKYGLDPDKIDWFLPHMSSGYFKKDLSLQMEEIGMFIPEERWFTNLEYKGNTGAASIWIMLEELFNSGRLEKGQKILCIIPESARFSYAYMHFTVV
ncbi:beta-ketoacyl-ACP synthase III [Synechocystis sp. PCC 7338]|uniref:beta-ketoacyl-ACP synthase III n=1 Tax=Synechocystis sp. PCC 7338 TaxID=2732530 RepID=UPI001BB02C60|nr:beta-ketoacyl-ACP synthase III [Synechocystis sp. PCC 7338]QUS61522.1 beta-ketoacyl-ACP synthase III [Synechocystis sp. PCC 7338]